MDTNQKQNSCLFVCIRGFSFPVLGALQLFALLGTALLAAPNIRPHEPTALVVTNTNDNGPGSLRAAIVAANDGDNIQFDAALNGQTIGLTTAELIIDKNITITGPGPDLLTVSRTSGLFRIFHLEPSHTATIRGLTIRNGKGNGGGILNDHATLTINNCTIRENTSLDRGYGGGIYNDGLGGSATTTIIASSIYNNRGFDRGGGIYNDGTKGGSVTLSLTNSSVNTNAAVYTDPPFVGGGDGGGIYNFGLVNVTLTNCTVNNNLAGAPDPPFPNGRGGGIVGGTLEVINSTINHNQTFLGGGGIFGASLTMTNSTVSGNQATATHDGIGYGEGGGIYSGGGTITNSTISDNFATLAGGGISGNLTIINSTISGNTGGQVGGGAIRGSGTISNCTISNNSVIQGEGGGIYVTGPLELGNTILKAGSSGANIFNNGGTVTSHGYNISSDNAGGFLTGPGDQINTDPLLGPLQDNGGPTTTYDLLPGSPAINAGDPNFTPPPLTDQRGYPRVFNGRLDIGSVEAQPVPTPTPSPATPTPTPNQCAYIFFNEHFDGVTAPALPQGWSSTFTSTPGACPPNLPMCTASATPGTDWTTTTINPSSPPNCAFHQIPACAADTSLYSPLFHNGVGSDNLIFEHSYNFESGRDGAVLEISINGGPFTDFVAAGGTFSGGSGYNGTIGTTFQNPLAGRQAWTGDSGGYRSVFATMPPQEGNIVLRFRIGTGCGGATGWRIDDINVVFIVPCATPSPTPSPTPCTPGPIFFSENFDSLPVGTPGSCSYISNIDPDTPPNDLFIADQDGISDCVYDLMSVPVPAASGTLRFRNNFNTEFSNGIYWDGGVLEVSSPNISGGDFVDITDSHVGGSFIAGGYTGEISGIANNPLAGRFAWSGDSGGYIDTVINLGPNLAGQNVTLRFRFGSDEAVGAPGWRIDTIVATEGVCPTATPTPIPTATATPTPSPTPGPAQALNLSTRMLVQTGDNVGIGGFIIVGSSPKQVLLRGIGPSLGPFGVPDPLADPVMELHGPAGFTTIINDNWREGPGMGVPIQATGLAPTNDLESAILETLDPGNYTAIVKGTNNGTGVGLVEIYDLDQAHSKLGNISTRAFVSTGADVVIGGFILGNGTENSPIVIRGIGPSLTQFGVPDALADPTLELHNDQGSLLAVNDNWLDDPSSAAQLIAHGLAPSDSNESGIYISISPGLYTAILAGKNGGTGVGLVEIYDLQ